MSSSDKVDGKGQKVWKVLDILFPPLCAGELTSAHHTYGLLCLQHPLRLVGSGGRLEAGGQWGHSTFPSAPSRPITDCHGPHSFTKGYSLCCMALWAPVLVPTPLLFGQKCIMASTPKLIHSLMLISLNPANTLNKIPLLNSSQLLHLNNLGRLDSSVGWASESWFQLRS